MSWFPVLKFHSCRYRKPANGRSNFGKHLKSKDMYGSSGLKGSNARMKSLFLAGQLLFWTKRLIKRMNMWLMLVTRRETVFTVTQALKEMTGHGMPENRMVECRNYRCVMWICRSVLGSWPLRIYHQGRDVSSRVAFMKYRMTPGISTMGK